ncbi:MAG: ribonuclease J [Alphaproteobacteria bacterium]
MTGAAGASAGTAAPVPGEELLFLPLGGAGEIGMNLNLYGAQGQWLMVDLGITFGDEAAPGIDVILPDPGFIVGQRERLAGLVLTHAHEDHIGAVPHLWPQLRCPIYATPFTARVLREKFEYTGLTEAEITEVPLSGSFEVGPFGLELVTLTHSIPEPNAVVVRTPFGSVLHTGDWKFDPRPVVGEVADEAGLRRIGDEGVLAMVCDSTNVFQPGESGSETDLRESLMELVGRFRHRVAITCFASNVARIETLAVVAAAHGRRPVLIGRALWRMVEAARATGYLHDLGSLMAEEQGKGLPRGEVLFICTGSQGESRAALSRIAAGNHPHVTLEEGDAVIFSSRLIPGNEAPIGRVINQFVRAGIEVLTEQDHFVHVSGHPARDELARMYRLVRPRIVVPVHGEARHLAEQARLARACQVPEAAVIENGDVLRLAPGPVEVTARVPSGRLAFDGVRLLELDGPVLSDRRRMIFNGGAVVTLAMTPEGRLVGAPQVSALGLVDSEEETEILEAAAGAVRDAVEALSEGERADDEVVREVARRAARRAVNAAAGRRPVTAVHLVRV